ncbi:FecCD family ABC transporter permease [Acetobacter conturbans]|uniref:Iron chelate uptake ABC transporter family permease subunit n=1 Tax=Acetobacter conturbans TaxID=1737472 RepID=A0ABX0K0B0_9PROT|nr:iron ABC transporter permease [Acetobacter conturbans]NHN89063.1 iron chelate uptake ABC transporter family permease subunit [Acetobacter conturbans]
MKGIASLACAFIVLVIVAVASLCVGRYPIPLHDCLQFLFSFFHASPTPSVTRSILLQLRLPRLEAAMLAGAALSVSGASYQAVFRNPLVSPGILGALSGAGFGAAVAIVLNYPAWMVSVSAFTGSVVAVLAGVGIARLSGDRSILMLIFGGLVSNALFTSLLSILKYLADPDDQLPDIVFWLLGTLARVTPETLSLVSLPMLVSIVLLCLTGRLLDALTLGDDEARSLGVPVVAVRSVVVILATLLSALTVAMAGIIGWVGLVVPHIARLIVGPGNRLVLPMSALIGAIFLLFADDLARCLSSAEIPIGIMTELSGVILFLILLPRVRSSLKGSWR